MAYYCGAVTASGGICRSCVSSKDSSCGWHTPLNTTCSVCMDSMTIRNHRELSCGHKFHKKCIQTWKNRGNRTCPLCRADFDAPQFRVTVTIEPLGEAANTHSFTRIENALTNLPEHMLAEITQLTTEADDLDDLRNVIESIGIQLHAEDYDNLLRNTE